MSSEALNAARSASTAHYQSFAEATRCALDLIERHFGDITPFLAHLDHGRDLHRIVDIRRGEEFGLRANHTQRLSESFCAYMAADRGSRLCNEVSNDPIYSHLSTPAGQTVEAYLGVPIELSDGARVASLAAFSTTPNRFEIDDEELFSLLATVLAHGLERESEKHDVRRLSSTLREQARAMAAVGGVARMLTSGVDARDDMCRAACEIAGAPVAFLLQPSSEKLVSTASAGTIMQSVTIHPRDGGDVREVFAKEPLFVANADEHSGLSTSLVESLKARSAYFEPILREDAVVGVIVVIWREAVATIPESVSSMLHVLAAQAGAVIEHANLRDRVDQLSLTDSLTGLPTARAWDEEIRREMARAERSETPLSIGFLEIDGLSEFIDAFGEAEGDRLIKEAAAGWSDRLRSIDYLVRLSQRRFAVLLPNCGLTDACDVVDRLRAVTPRDRTSVAGIARWDGEEPVDFLVDRCDSALQMAVQAGGDITMPAE